MSRANDIIVQLKAKDLASGAIAKVSARMEKFSNQAKAQSVRFQEMANKYTASSIAAGAGIAAIMHSGVDFSKTMNMVGAVSGSTGQAFEKLEAQAKQLGASTQFSAVQAAEAQKFLAMAGNDTQTIYAALPKTLSLAAAAQLDMGSSANIVTNVMAGFGLQADQLGNAVDVLSKAFTSSNTDLVGMGEAMKYVGPVASGMGVSLEETAATIGILGNAGIQASMAGTALRGAIVKLSSPTKEAEKIIGQLGLKVNKSNGEFIGFESVVRQLQESGANTAQIMEIFGQRAGPAMAALVGQGADAIGDLNAKLQESGGIADEIANRQMEGLAGAYMRFKSALEGTLISLSEGFVPIMKLVATAMQAVAATMEALPGPAKIAVAGLLAFAALRAPVLFALSGITAAMGGLSASLLAIPPAMAKVTLAMGAFMLTPVGAALTAITATVAAGTLVWKKFSDAAAEAEQEVAAKMEAMENKSFSFFQGIQDAQEEVNFDAAVAQFVDMKDTWDKTQEELLAEAARGALKAGEIGTALGLALANGANHQTVLAQAEQVGVSISREMILAAELDFEDRVQLLEAHMNAKLTELSDKIRQNLEAQRAAMNDNSLWGMFTRDSKISKLSEEYDKLYTAQIKLNEKAQEGGRTMVRAFDNTKQSAKSLEQQINELPAATEKVVSKSDRLQEGYEKFKKKIEGIATEHRSVMSGLTKELNDYKQKMDALTDPGSQRNTDFGRSVAGDVVAMETELAERRQALASATTDQQRADEQARITELEGSLSKNADFIKSIEGQIAEERRLAGMDSLSRKIEEFKMETEELRRKYEGQSLLLTEKIEREKEEYNRQARHHSRIMNGMLQAQLAARAKAEGITQESLAREKDMLSVAVDGFVDIIGTQAEAPALQHFIDKMDAVFEAAKRASSVFGGANMRSVGSNKYLGGRVRAFASGGISSGFPAGVLNSPTLSLAGEAGPEAIVPLPDGKNIPVLLRGGGRNGGGNNITINVTVQGSVHAERELADSVSRVMFERLGERIAL